jgi:hypothetical protein
MIGIGAGTIAGAAFGGAMSGHDMGLAHVQPPRPDREIVRLAGVFGSALGGRFRRRSAGKLICRVLSRGAQRKGRSKFRLLGYECWFVR